MKGSGKSSLNRRELVAGLGGAAVGAVVSSAKAEAQKTGATVAPFVDPTTKYPKPPYDTTQQPWPGLASKMIPPPDHGETSYKGSGRLMGRKAIITGGDSGMGACSGDCVCARGRRCGDCLLPD